MDADIIEITTGNIVNATHFTWSRKRGIPPRPYCPISCRIILASRVGWRMADV